MAIFELDLSRKTELPGKAKEGLGSALLVENAQWFTRIRWVVATVFTVVAVGLYLFESKLLANQISTPYAALLVLAAVLIAANSLFVFLSFKFDTNTPLRQVKAVIWGQILLDLVVLTALVYVVGSTATFVPFTYLFHIALACIFFPPRNSLLVTIIAIGLYVMIVLLEAASILPHIAMIGGRSGGGSTFPMWLEIFQVATAVFVWLVVWYLVSTLSEGVRRRDRQLQLMNGQLIEADKEKNQQMLVTTHDLKAPFSGIESNIEVLKVKFWDHLPSDAQAIIERINNRSRLLRHRINTILMLGELRSQDNNDQIEMETLDLSEPIQIVCEDLGDRAEERNVTIECSLDAARVRSNRRRLIVLFENLISNAISYSHEGGTVEVHCRLLADSVQIEIVDHGIGIRSDALPHIFEEYYRSREAARFNRGSTGLGLAIVREIAVHLRLRVSVESEEGKGTRVSILIPDLDAGTQK